MMKILCIPLDERPCNMLFPQMIADTRTDVTLCMPERHLLGNKKESANVDALWNYLFENIKTCDYAILSLDMLLYGGLIPSRIHMIKEEILKKRIALLQTLKTENETCKLYAFQCIMRSPHYNSGEEEPAYYEEFGEALFKRAYYMDKKNRFSLSDTEACELTQLSVPNEVLDDYERRRELNLMMNLNVLDILKGGALDYLVIPQDDSSEFGYTAIAQKKVTTYIQEQRLEFLCSVYPGADEVACSLLARALNDALKRKVRIYPFYASTLGSSIIPLYEDRPMQESLKSHVRICGGILCDTMQEADFVLAINAPGKCMQESFDQKASDITYTTHRNLLAFVDKIADCITIHKPVAICDSAFSNGGDLAFLDYLDRNNLFDKILSYAGWNTNCNSLGTCLSSAIYTYDIPPSDKKLHHLFYRLLEDGFYQASVRQEVIQEFLPKEGLSYYDFKDKQPFVEEEIRARLLVHFHKMALAKRYDVKIKQVSMPWKRMFEIGLDVEITKK